jgi:hypothetical protein
VSAASEISSSKAHTHTFTSNSSDTILISRLIKLRTNDTSSNFEGRPTVRLGLVALEELDTLKAMGLDRQETYGLLPANHFGARKQRSAEQALILLQEHIFSAWRSRHVVSLVSFDVKGAYNGVCKERLLQRMKARGIPESLLRWIDAFCSERTATIVINGQSSESRPLPQAGLPQGSSLSPTLFLFFNADLV